MESWNHMSADAVRTHSPDEVNRRIDERVERCVRYMAQQERSEIGHYLHQLEGEWDLNRTLTVSCSVASLGGLLLARGLGRGWLGLSALASGLLLHQGLAGHGPLAALVRGLGVRTRREIDLEKFALKALRGDFERIPTEGGPLARANAALVAAQS
jgi:hypothetical protein